MSTTTRTQRSQGPRVATATAMPRTGNRRVRAATLLIALAGCMALAIGHVARRHEAIRLGYELSAARAEHRAALEENRRLALERSMLRHPDRIGRIAAGMGMRPPEPEQIRVVRSRAALARHSRRSRK